MGREAVPMGKEEEKTAQMRGAERENSDGEKRGRKREKVEGEARGKREGVAAAVCLRRKRRVHARWVHKSPRGAVTLQRCPEKSLLHRSSVGKRGVHT
eukprot:2465967-Rhodomonas_salina.2